MNAADNLFEGRPAFSSAVPIRRNGGVYAGVIDLSWPENGDELAVSQKESAPTYLPRDWEDVPNGPCQDEHLYVTWTPVTAATCRTVLENTPYSKGANVWVRARDEGLEWLAGKLSNQSPTLAPARTVAAWLEAALVTKDKAVSLFEQLRRETEAMMTLVSQHVENSRTEALQQIDDARNSWEAP